MKAKYAKLEQQVKTILTNVPLTRDSDEALYAQILKLEGLDTATMTVQRLLQGMFNRIYPSWESVSRWRRMVQVNHPELRGEDWVKRHSDKISETKTDLGYINTEFDAPGMIP